MRRNWAGWQEAQLRYAFGSKTKLTVPITGWRQSSCTSAPALRPSLAPQATKRLDYIPLVLETIELTLWAEGIAWLRPQQLDAATPIPFSGWQDWDERGVLKAEHPLYWRP